MRCSLGIVLAALLVSNVVTYPDGGIQYGGEKQQMGVLISKSLSAETSSSSNSSSSSEESSSSSSEESEGGGISDHRGKAAQAENIGSTSQKTTPQSSSKTPSSQSVSFESFGISSQQIEYLFKVGISVKNVAHITKHHGLSGSEIATLAQHNFKSKEIILLRKAGFNVDQLLTLYNQGFNASAILSVAKRYSVEDVLKLSKCGLPVKMVVNFAIKKESVNYVLQYAKNWLSNKKPSPK